jgi:hypothetical protein
VKGLGWVRFKEDGMNTFDLMVSGDDDDDDDDDDDGSGGGGGGGGDDDDDDDDDDDGDEDYHNQIMLGRAVSLIELVMQGSGTRFSYRNPT